MPATDPLGRLSAGERFPAIDGLRALSALAVLLFHVGAVSAVNAGGGSGPYVNLLAGGVSVFFVMSGFLLYRPFVVAHLHGSSAPETVPFYWRRVLRIFPAYWLVLAVATWWFQIQTLGHGPLDALRHIFLLQGFWVGTVLGGLQVAWSLGTELSFYLYLPLHAWFLRRYASAGTTLEDRIRSEYLMCGALVVLSLGFKAVILVDKARVGPTWLPAYFDIFALGMALAVASVAAQERGGPGRWQAQVVAAPVRMWLGAGLAYAGLVLVGMPVGFVPIDTGTYLLRQEGLGLVAVLLVAPMVLGHDRNGGEVGGRLRRGLGGPVAAWFGNLSYGIYLWHLPMILLIDRHLRGDRSSMPFWPLLGLTVVATVPAAAASWYLLERPVSRLRKRGFGRQRARASAP